MPLDLSLFNFFNHLAGASLIGDLTVVFLAQYLPYLIILAFLIWVFFQTRSWREKIYLMLTGAVAGLVARFVVGEIIRFFYHRPRPFLVHDVIKLISETSWSFPSGHTLFFFALSTIVYLRYKKWGWTFYVASLIMAFARVAAGVHYPTDILGGIILGLGTGVGIHYLMGWIDKKWGPNLKLRT